MVFSLMIDVSKILMINKRVVSQAELATRRVSYTNVKAQHTTQRWHALAHVHYKGAIINFDGMFWGFGAVIVQSKTRGLEEGGNHYKDGI